LEVKPEADAEPDATKDVAAQYVAGPVVAQVDTRWTHEYDKERGNNQERDPPPTISFEEDDRERKQQAPEGKVLHLHFHLGCLLLNLSGSTEISTGLDVGGVRLISVLQMASSRLDKRASLCGI